jgi:ABC-2 type transport system permease protein
VIATGGRGLIISAVCAAAGFALALVSRHTIAALGAVLGYLVVRFVLLILTDPIPALQKIKPWTLENNARAVLEHGYRYTDEIRRLTPDGVSYTQIERSLSFGHGLTYLIALFVIMVLGSALIFRRRDIT